MNNEHINRPVHQKADFETPEESTIGRSFSPPPFAVTAGSEDGTLGNQVVQCSSKSGKYTD
ncbi:MAG: hypothetical protein AAF570_00750, partial [Bacteroidota bacterium]